MDTKQEARADEVLWDRMSKVIEDPNVDSFKLNTWHNGEPGGRSSVLIVSTWGAVVHHHGALADWRVYLEKALDEWDEIKKAQPKE